MSIERNRSRAKHPALVFGLVFLIVLGLHLPLLRLPYFWDEAGYYVPAARDILLSGSLIPQSTPSNAHPPLVLAYLALCWKLAGYSPVVTRVAMLLLSTLALLGLYRLAARLANPEVATAATICTALYPVFFAQSSLAQVDLAAAGLCFWGLWAYAGRRWAAAAVWFCLAVLAKETAVLVPAALLAWEIAARWLPGLRQDGEAEPGWGRLWLLSPPFCLAIWYAYHYRRTGYVFGNPEFFRYNVQATLSPLRIFLALLLRLWQTFGYMGLFLLTLAGLAAMFRRPRKDGNEERGRIPLRLQFALLAVTAVYVAAMSVVGGAVLARYMLPVVPLGIVLWVSTLWRRVESWRAVVAIVALAFVAGWFRNPPYGFAPEDNLAYRDYIVLHQHAEEILESRFPSARVLTAWPANDELSRPYLGYVTRPMQVVRIDDFSLEQVMSAADMRQRFDVALVFSTKVEPNHALLENWRRWQEWKTRYFGYHRDVPAAVAAQILGGHLVFSENLGEQWVGVIEMERVYDARQPESGSAGHEMAGMGLDHQPDLAARLQSERVPGREGEVHFHLESAIHADDHHHIALHH